jgi:hypothetical protein
LNEEKNIKMPKHLTISNCARARAIQIQNRTRSAKVTAMNEYRGPRRREKHMFRKKKGQFENQALIEIERHHFRTPANFISDARKPFEPAVVMW